MDYGFRNLKRWRIVPAAFAALAAFTLSASPDAAATPAPITSVTLAWNPSTSTTVIGYRVSYGLSSRSYTQQVDVGNKTSVFIPALLAGKIYYFAVSAYNAAGTQSSLSNEVSVSTNPPGSTPTPTPTTNPNSPHLTNVSARARVGLGNNVEIAGFTVSGTARKTVVIRGLGPTLAKYGIAGTLLDPWLEVHNAAGDLIASNDNWANAQQSSFAAGGRYHAFQPSKNIESAIVLSLSAGAYTVVLGGKKGAQGAALAEIYDLSQDGESRLTNISARAQVLTGEDVLIGGVTVAGSGSLKLVVRAIGPTLVKYGVTNALQNPTIALYNSNGTLLRSSDSWISDANEASQLTTTGYAPTDSREPAMIVLLPAGTYTAIVEGGNGATGIALFDAYTLN